MSQGLRIGLVLPALPGYSETFIRSKIKGLLENGHTVSLFINYYNKSSLIDIEVPVYAQVNVARIYLLPLIFFSVLITHPLRICEFIKLERGENNNWITVIKHIIINAHIINKRLDWLHFEFATMGIQRENAAKVIGAKSAVSFRGFDIGLYPYQHEGCYNLLWKIIDRVHTISDDLYHTALNFGLNPDTPMQKITPAIDTTQFIASSIDDLHEPIRILSVGRLVWKKGFENALQTLTLLKRKGFNFEYKIIGEGDYREAIIYAIEQLGLRNEVTVTGKFSQEQIKEQMEWADIYIQPSIQEGFCNAVLEAQSMGLLCIVTDADGLKENVLDGKTGWVVPKRSPECMFKQIVDILSMESSDREKIINNATTRIKEKFNLLDQSKYWDEFYNNH